MMADMHHYPVLLFVLCLLIAGIIGVIGWIILAVAIVAACVGLVMWAAGRINRK